MQSRKGITPFRALPWQVDPWLCKDFAVLLTGAAGGGKSRFAAEKVHAFLLKYSGATGLVVRKTRESMKNSTIAFLRNVVIGGDPRVRYVPSQYRFEYANGSVLIWGGMKDDDQREAIRSVGQEGGVDFCWMEEATAFKESDYNEILARMRGSAASYRQIILTTNPDSPYHWIKLKLIDGGGASVFRSRWSDNRYNPEQYEEILDLLTGVQRKRLRDGLWVQADGMVYNEFDEDVHLVDWFNPPSHWPRRIAVDFGFTNPMVVQWWAFDDDKRMYMYRELYHTGMLVDDVAQRMIELSEGEHIEYAVCDHDAEDRATLEKAGFETRAAIKDVDGGIKRVKNRLKIRQDKKPRLFFMRGALMEPDKALVEKYAPLCTEQEIYEYIWDIKKSQTTGKDVPKKDKDHGCDATRYMVMDTDRGNEADVVTVEEIRQKIMAGEYDGIEGAA